MRIREIREARGIKQSQAALGLNLSPSLYNRYENGTREVPNALLPVIADYFCVSVDELFGREGGNQGMENVPRTPEARIVSAGMDKMPQEARETILSVVRAMYQKDHPELFDEEEVENNDA